MEKERRRREDGAQRRKGKKMRSYEEGDERERKEARKTEGRKGGRRVRSEVVPPRVKLIKTVIVPGKVCTKW